MYTSFSLLSSVVAVSDLGKKTGIRTHKDVNKFDLKHKLIHKNVITKITELDVLRHLEELFNAISMSVTGPKQIRNYAIRIAASV
jgi:hypothetical protein